MYSECGISPLVHNKGQLIPKAKCQAVDSPKKRMNEFDSFAVKSKVRIFCGGHKILQNLPLTFDYSTYCQM